jgi:hypothetical protein
VADNDYQAKSGHFTFQPGEATQSVTVTVFGDTRVEPNETFNLVLSNPTNATIIGGPGVGLITNDDTNCSPRPGVQTQTAAGSLNLTTNVTATPLNNQQQNLLTELRFGEMTNARVIVNGETITSAKTIKLDPGQPFVTFIVQRIYPHMATTVPITLVDGCGEWKTMVGGGPHAGF